VEVRDTFLAAAGASAEQLFQRMKELRFFSYDYDVRRDIFRRNDAVRSGELIIFTRRELQ